MGDIGGAAQGAGTVVGDAEIAAAQVADTAMTDAANIYMQNKQLGWSAQQANLARQFDASQQQSSQRFAAGQQVQAERYNTEMSNTAMQRRVQDLRAANLNPLLAVGNLGGASTPTMSAASAGTLGGPAASPPGLPSLTPLTAGLQGALTGAAQRRLLESQQQGVDFDNRKKQAELPWAAANAQAGYNNLVATREQLMAQVRTLASQFNYNEANANKAVQDKDFAAQLQPLAVKLKTAEAAAAQYGLPPLEARADWYKNNPLQAGTIIAGQEGAKIGVGAGWFESLMQAFKNAATQRAAPGQPDINAPTF